MKGNIHLIITVFFFLISSGVLVFKEPIASFLVKNLSKDLLANRERVEEIKKETGQWLANADEAIFLNQKVSSPLAEFPLEEKVLGEVAGQEKKIEIDLSDQRLLAWEGNKLIYDFPVSTGKWAPTPLGTFRIWIKLRYSLMHGGSKEKGTYYYLPNVPYVMYFYQGYGIHGAYWHNNFGTPMSHGCVNMAISDAALLFAWTDPFLPSDKSVVYPTKENPGTEVIIHQ